MIELTVEYVNLNYVTLNERKKWNQEKEEKEEWGMEFVLKRNAHSGVNTVGKFSLDQL